MHYCGKEQGPWPDIMWIIIILSIFHRYGLKFLEEYCLILPPPKIDNEKQKIKRPAVYLLKIPLFILSSWLLIPAAVEVYIPNIIRTTKNLVSYTHFDVDNEDFEVILTSNAASWVCYRESVCVVTHMVTLVFEVISFQLEQPNALLIHHFATMALIVGRLFHSSEQLTYASDWLWLALSLHLTIYSVNVIRLCYSFARDFLTGDSYSSGISSLKNLFDLVNTCSWAIILFGYFVTVAVALIRDDGKVQEVFACFGVVLLLSFGSVKEIMRSREAISIDSSSMRLFFRLILEITIGLFLAPVLLLLDYLFPDETNKFTKKSSHKNTAGGVVSLRALCNVSSDQRLYIDDPFAIRFVKSGIPRLICKSAILRYFMSLKLESQHPGALGHLITRTKTIDEIIGDLISRKKNAISQLVILGAGYDTRAYRLRTLKDVVVFEIDQNFMSSEKQQKCADLTPLCKKLVHLSTDFNKENVMDVLNACDVFDPSKPTFFIWEGVQVYLSDNSVDKMFASLRSLNQTVTQPEQFLYFTFSDKRILTQEGRQKIYGGKEFFEYANGIGERVQSGIDPTNIEEYLLARGFMLYEYSPCSGLTGHMTPNQKQEAYLSRHPFIRQSEVFHGCLARNV